MLELRHLRYFDALATELNFTRAAERLHMAQPPLSRQIRELEDRLGAPLVDRGSRPLKLTPAGQFFHSQTVQLLQRLAEIEQATARIARSRQAWFGVGFVPSTLYGTLPEVIRRFREAHADVDVGLSELTTVQQLEALKAGRIDIGFGRLQFDDPAIEGTVIAQEPVVAALPAGHRLARGKRLDLPRLAREPLLLYPARPRPSYADHVLTMFRARGLQPKVAIEVNELQTAIGLVVAGVGYALVPESVQGLHRDCLTYVPLDDAALASPVIMNCRAGDASPLCADFRELVRQVARRRKA